MTGETRIVIGQGNGGQDWYEIELEGRFDPGWFDWLEEWDITPLLSGNTLLSGRVADQPALHGIFAHIRDMNVRIISLKSGARPSTE